MENTIKQYKVTYKTYFNERLQKSLFHTKLMHPLYVQIIFDRVPIIFKSYYYDLFSKSKYVIHVAEKVFTPDIKEIIQKEEKLIEFIIDKNLQKFSLDIFKKEYAFYSRDLPDIMEEDFLEYLFTFLHDEGMPFLANTLKKGASNAKLYDLMQNLKVAFNPELYKKLIENSFYYAPPYLQVYTIMLQLKTNQSPLITLCVMDWEQSIQNTFTDFFKNTYPGYNVTEVIKKIKKFIDN